MLKIISKCLLKLILVKIQFRGESLNALDLDVNPGI